MNNSKNPVRSNDDKSMNCEVCGTNFSTKSNLTKHTKNNMNCANISYERKIYKKKIKELEVEKANYIEQIEKLQTENQCMKELIVQIKK